MPSDRIRPHASVIDIDNERLKFWKSLGLIRSIRREVLELTGWLRENGNEPSAVEVDGKLIRAPPNLLGAEKDYSAVFSMPKSEVERRTLRKFLSDFELVLSQRSHIDRLIEQTRAELGELDRQLQQEGTTTEGASKVQALEVNKNWKSKQLRDLQYNRDWLLRQRGVMCSAFNALLNTMHFDVSEISLAEMRYQSAASKVRVERLVSDLDND